jgi:DNA-binding phage protein
MDKFIKIFLNELIGQDYPPRSLILEAKLMAQENPIMRQALYTMTLEAFFKNDYELGKHLLRLLIHTSIGFEALAKELDMASNNVMRMFSIRGNPTSRNIFQILHIIRIREHMRLNIEVQIPRIGTEPSKSNA